MLQTISKPEPRAILATITGDAGVGKTTLASTFPKPVFIRAEDGMQSIPVEKMPDAFPVIDKVDDLWEQLKALISQEHSYKTVVIDSVTALERLFIQYVIESDPKKPKSITQALGGFGAGLMAVSSMHQRVLKASKMLIGKGINVVFIAHADTETMELPDEEPYMRYNLRLGKKSVAPYTDDVDLVAFLKLETFVDGEDGKKSRAKSSGERIVVAYATAANISKNRFGITEDILAEKGKNPFMPYIKILQQQGENNE